MRYQNQKTFYHDPTDGVVEIRNIVPLFEGNDDGIYRAETLEGTQLLVTATGLRYSPATETELQEDSNV